MASCPRELPECEGDKDASMADGVLAIRLGNFVCGSDGINDTHTHTHTCGEWFAEMHGDNPNDMQMSTVVLERLHRQQKPLNTCNISCQQ